MSLSGYVPKSLRMSTPATVQQSLIYGGDESSYSTITDIVAAINSGNPSPLQFLITRGWTGYSDDQQYRKTADLLKDVVVKDAVGKALGSLLWGSYMYLSYGPGSRDGLGQAQNFWSLINSGGSHYWQIMPAVDCEREPYLDNGVIQYHPLPPLEVYLDTKLMPAIEYLEKQYGRLPLLYSNLDLIMHYFKPAYGRADHKYDKLFQCPLWLAIYSNRVPAADIVAPMWKQWAIWQERGDVHDRPGISDIDYNEWPGSRAEFKAWLADPSAPIPPYSTDTTPVPCPAGQQQDPATGNCVPDPDPCPSGQHIDPATGHCVPNTETWATIQVPDLKIRTAPDTSTEVNRIGTGVKGKSFKVAGKKTVGNITFVQADQAWLAVNNGKDVYLKLEEKPIQ